MATNRAPRRTYVRSVLMATLTFGVFLHVTALIAGRGWMLDHVLSPAVDVALIVPMAYAAIGMWLQRRWAVHPRPSHRIVYYGIAGYMAVSAVVHLETLFVGEVRYVTRFPQWYSWFIIPAQAGMLVYAWRLRFRAATAVEESPASIPNVVVVGAGFAGLEAATRLRGAASHGRMRVTVVDRNNHHVFQPLLYQVATAALDPQDIAYSVRSVLPQTDQVRFRMGTVVAIDTEQRVLELADGSELGWDQLVLAAGVQPADFGVPGVSEHAFTLKSLSDARTIRNHLLRQFEEVTAGHVPGDALHVVVCGGGPTGVELAGALAELTGEVLTRDFGFDCDDVAVTLVELGERLLPSFTPASSEYARRALQRRGVTVITGSAVAEVEPAGVTLGDGTTLASRTVIWCAGVRASDLPAVSQLPRERTGRVPVAGDLTVASHADIHVIGDLAGAIDGHTYPQLATVAIQQGRHAAEQVLRRLRGEPLTGFRYRSYGQWATIGRNLAVIELADGRLRLRGAAAWILWSVAHIMRLEGMRNRASVAVNWAWHYLTHDRAARLILDEDDRPDPTLPARSEAARDQKAVRTGGPT